MGCLEFSKSDTREKGRINIVALRHSNEKLDKLMLNYRCLTFLVTGPT